MRHLVVFVQVLLLGACGGRIDAAWTSEPGDAGRSVEGDSPNTAAERSVGSEGPGSDVVAIATAERSSKCLSLGEERILTVDLDTGAIEEGPILGPRFLHVNAVGIVGDRIVACGYDGRRFRPFVVDRTTGKLVGKGSRHCDAITADERGIWLLSSFDERVVRYTTYRALLADEPEGEIPAPFASVLGPGPIAKLYATLHSTDEVLLVDSSGDETSRPLEGFDGWIYGVSVATNGRLVVSSPAGLGGEGALVVFDAATGNRLERIGKRRSFHGISCVFTSALD